MILVDGNDVKLRGTKRNLALEFVRLYEGLNRMHPDVIDAALTIIEKSTDDDFGFKVLRNESSIK